MLTCVAMQMSTDGKIKRDLTSCGFWL